MIIAGIDYSMTSPAIVVHKGDTWSVDNCTLYYMVKSGKYMVVNDLLKGSMYPTNYKSEYERYQQLATWTLKTILDEDVEKCYIEDYAFGATGRVFHIAENTGLMKYSLWNLGVDFETFAPTSIKKYATGKGNANKEALYETWLNETQIDLRVKLNITSEKMWNPLSDIVDAYYIAKMGFEQNRLVTP